MNHGWKTLSSQIVYQNPWFKVRHDKTTRPDGTTGEYNTVIKPNAVHIVVVNGEDKILLINLFRYSVSRTSWEVPAGAVDVREAPLTAAKRELREETGFVAGDWQAIGAVETATGYIDGTCHQFVARKLQKTGHDAQVEEGITDMRAFSRAEIKQMVLNDEVFDAPSVAILSKFLLSESQI